MGPAYVAIKKGEHGALLFGEDEFFSCGAYPLEDIHDPTGAGDTFAGGIAGYLAGTVKKVHFNDLRKAMIYGSVLASFCVEAFSLERLRKLSMEEIKERYETFKLMSQFEVLFVTGRTILSSVLSRPLPESLELKVVFCHSVSGLAPFPNRIRSRTRSAFIIIVDYTRAIATLRHECGQRW